MHVERDQSRLPRNALRAAAASSELRCQADPRPYHAVRRLTRGGNLLGRRHVRARLSQRRLEGGVPDWRVGSMLAAAHGGAGPRQASLSTGSTEPEQTTPGRHSVGFKKHGSGAMTCSQLAPNATPSKPFELRGLATDPEEWARLPRGKNFHSDAPVGGAMAAKGERGLLRPT